MTTSTGAELATTDDVVDGVVVWGEDEARKAVSQIKQADTTLWNRVVDAYIHRVWEPLGYDNWRDFVSGELASVKFTPTKDARADVVKALVSKAGMSSRAIEDVTGMSASTVQRVVRKLAQEDESFAPLVVGTDGRKQNRSSENRRRGATGSRSKSGPVDASHKVDPETVDTSRVPLCVTLPENKPTAELLLRDPDTTVRKVASMLGRPVEAVEHVQQSLVQYGGVQVREIADAAVELADRIGEYVDSDVFNPKYALSAVDDLKRAQAAVNDILVKLYAGAATAEPDDDADDSE